MDLKAIEFRSPAIQKSQDNTPLVSAGSAERCLNRRSLRVKRAKNIFVVISWKSPEIWGDRIDWRTIFPDARSEIFDYFVLSLKIQKNLEQLKLFQV